MEESRLYLQVVLRYYMTREGTPEDPQPSIQAHWDYNFGLMAWREVRSKLFDFSQVA